MRLLLISKGRKMDTLQCLRELPPPDHRTGRALDEHRIALIGELRAEAVEHAVIAAWLGCSPITVKRYARQLGVSATERRDVEIRQLAVRGWGPTMIAAWLGVSRSTVWRVLRKDCEEQR